MGPPNLPAKVCPTCGRTFAWRKKWARHWAEVVHCSDRCRARRKRDEVAELEARILALLAERARGVTLRASEVLLDAERQDPRRLESVRAAARRLAHDAVIDILQGGVVVDPDHARGPIELRLKSARRGGERDRGGG